MPGRTGERLQKWLSNDQSRVNLWPLEEIEPQSNVINWQAKMNRRTSGSAGGWGWINELLMASHKDAARISW